MKRDLLNCMARTCLAILATLAGTPAAAKQLVSLDSTVFVERQQSETVRSLEPVNRLSPGDRVVTVVTWQRIGPIAGGKGSFTVTNPLPRTVTYQDSARDDEEVSIDGGHSWGKLSALRIGSRNATPEDVTHVRWRITSTTAAQRRGQIAYSGIVR